MILILDLGSHDNSALARKIREFGTYSEIYPHDVTADEIKKLKNVKGIIINGGPNNVVNGEKIDDSFLAPGGSRHNQGLALDLTLETLDGKELKMQTTESRKFLQSYLPFALTFFMA